MIPQEQRRVSVIRIGPDGVSFTTRKGEAERGLGTGRRRGRGVKFIAASPAAPVGMLHVIQPVGNQPQERRGVSLHAVGNIGILGAQRAMPLLNVFREPGVADDLAIRARKTCVIARQVALSHEPGLVI
jgi:hypothetical protein